MRTLISNATIVNEGVSVTGHIVIDGDTLSQVSFDSDTPHGSYDRRIDAMGCVVMPGVIDTHVHFREPGLTQKADIASESRAAAFGGVTTFFDMPNTVPQTVTLEALDEKNHLAAVKSHVNYAFFFGATNDNTALLDRLDPHLVPGIKLFMGSSTGNMLVDSDEALRRLFAQATLPIMAHCEDTALINGAMADIMSRYGDDPSVTFHPQVRSAEACYASTSHAVALAREYGARLHVAHVSTQRELELFEPYDGNGALPLVTAEAVIAHLLFTDADYATDKCQANAYDAEECSYLHLESSFLPSSASTTFSSFSAKTAFLAQRPFLQAAKMFFQTSTSFLLLSGIRPMFIKI